MYKIVLTQRAVKDTKKLNSEIKHKIGLKLKELKSTSTNFQKNLVIPKLVPIELELGIIEQSLI